MNKQKRNRIIVNVISIVAIIVLFVIINIRISQGYKQKFKLVADDAKYCYGIDSFDRDGELLTLNGWFFENKCVRNTPQSVSRDEAEHLIALIPLDEAIVGSEVDCSSIMKVEAMHKERPDVNEYFSCEYDYSKSGFTVTIDCDDIDLKTNSYRIAIKLDAEMSSKAVLTNLYITDDGLSYTDPRQSPKLDTKGTDLDRIVNEGVRLVSRPDVGCYVYQMGDKIYWIADSNYAFCEDDMTYMIFHIDTTQINNLPLERLENNAFWSSIGGYFEQYEITDQIKCGKYRVMMRDIPREYSVVNAVTGYYDDDEKWLWKEMFKLNYRMLK